MNEKYAHACWIYKHFPTHTLANRPWLHQKHAVELFIFIMYGYLFIICLFRTDCASFFASPSHPFWISEVAQNQQSYVFTCIHTYISAYVIHNKVLLLVHNYEIHHFRNGRDFPPIRTSISHCWLIIFLLNLHMIYLADWTLKAGRDAANSSQWYESQTIYAIEDLPIMQNNNNFVKIKCIKRGRGIIISQCNAMAIHNN